MDYDKIYKELQVKFLADAKRVAEDVYRTKGTRFGVAEIPVHIHDGVDCPRINEDNLILGNKLTGQLTTDTSETFTLTNVANVSRISFYGFAANNVSLPATKRAVVNGEIIFGRCNIFTGTGSSISVTTNNQGVPFIQASNYMYVDSALLTNNRVGSSNKLVEVSDSSASVVASLNLDTYSNNILTFTSSLASGWQITGIITII